VSSHFKLEFHTINIFQRFCSLIGKPTCLFVRRPPHTLTGHSSFMPFTRILKILCAQNSLALSCRCTSPEVDQAHRPLTFACSHASASALLERGRTLLAFQSQTSRFWVWWSQAFTATVSLAAICVQAPGCTLAASALEEVDVALEVRHKFGRSVPR